MLFGKLLPREGNFFELFNQHAGFIAEGARAIAQAEGVAFKPRNARHPIEIFAEAYGLTEQT